MKLFKLIYNELYKIFHKKLIYILAIIAVLITGLSGFLTVKLNNNSVNALFIETYRQELKDLDLSNATNVQAYVTMQPIIDAYDISKEKKLDPNGPAQYFLDNKISDVITNYYNAKYVEKNEEKAKELEEEKNELISKLDNFDWKAYINEQLEQMKNLDEIGLTDDTAKEMKRVYEYRLNNDIPLAYTDASQELDNYLTAYASYDASNKKDTKLMNHNEKYSFEMAQAQVAKYQYKIDNNLIKSDYKAINAQSSFVGIFGSVSLFITVCIVMIAGQIVAEEYSKGTIKQLLVRPYTRGKIIISKTIATLIVVFGFMLFLSIIEGLVAGIATNSFGSLFQPIVEYNYNTHQVFTMNTISAAFMNLVGILPELLILTLFTVLISALIGNTALAVVLGFILTFIPGMFSGMIDKFKILSYLPIFTWDISEFLYGGMSFSESLTLPKAIGVDVVTIIALIFGIILVFKKKEIKNQ